MVDVLKYNRDTFFVQGFYAHRISILARSKKVASAIIAVKSSKGFCRRPRSECREILYGAQLSFIQLGGGIAVGVYAEEKKIYTLLDTPQMLVLEGASTGVRTTTSARVFSFIYYNNITPQIWNVGSVLCDIITAVCMTYYMGFPIFLPLVLHSHSLFTMAAFTT